MAILARTVPVAQAALFLGTWALCYGLATGLGHVPFFLPMISDCLVLPPEGNIARFGMVTSIDLLLINVFLTYRWLKLAGPARERPCNPLLSARVDCGLGLVASALGMMPMVVNEDEEGRRASPCSGAEAENATGWCNATRGAIPFDGICFEKLSGAFQWHSVCALLFFLLFLVYIIRTTIHCEYLRRHPPLAAAVAPPSLRSVQIKATAALVFCVALVGAESGHRPSSSITARTWTATCEWVAALCVEAFVLSTALDYSHVGLDALCSGEAEDTRHSLLQVAADQSAAAAAAAAAGTTGSNNSSRLSGGDRAVWSIQDAAQPLGSDLSHKLTPYPPP